MRSLTCAMTLMMFLPAVEVAGDAQSYPDGRGGEIVLPMGELSFADRVVRFDEGSPHSKIEESRDPSNLLGPPEPDDGNSTFVTLGCRGSVIMELVDNALIDIDGPDLHVWEIGPDVEPTNLAISRNGNDWLEVGRISGGTASVDISDHVQPGESFRFVRLTDVECQGRGGRWPGADIDAVAAVGTAERFVFDSAVLFEFDESVIRDDAREVLESFAGKISGREIASMTIEGHTDSVGSSDYNDELSLERAESVKQFLETVQDLSGIPIRTRGAGESEPVASNETEEGRAKNRRVEIIVIPAS